jgi:hypothetical protein
VPAGEGVDAPLRVPPTTFAVGKGAHDPSALPGDPVLAAEREAGTEALGASAVRVGAPRVSLTLFEKVAAGAELVAVGSKERVALTERVTRGLLAVARAEALASARDALDEAVIFTLARVVAETLEEEVYEPPTRFAVGKGSREPTTLASEGVSAPLAERRLVADGRQLRVPWPVTEGLPVTEGVDEVVAHTEAAIDLEEHAEAVLLGVATGLRDPVRVSAPVAGAEGEPATRSDALTVTVGPFCVPLGQPDGVGDEERDGDRVTVPDTVPLTVPPGTVLVDEASAVLDAEKDCVTLWGSEKDCVPLFTGVCVCVAGGDSDGEPRLEKEPPPRSAPGAAATVADTLGDASGFERLPVPLTQTLFEGARVALPTEDAVPETHAEGVEEIEGQAVVLALVRCVGLSRERVLVTVHEKVCDVESVAVCDTESRGLAEYEAVMVDENDTTGERVLLTEARADFVTELVEDCEGETLELALTVPRTTCCVGKGAQEPSTLPAEGVSAAVRLGADKLAAREREKDPVRVLGSALQEMEPDTVEDATTEAERTALRVTALAVSVGLREAIADRDADGQGVPDDDRRPLGLTPDAVKLGEEAPLRDTLLAVALVEAEPPTTLAVGKGSLEPTTLTAEGVSTPEAVREGAGEREALVQPEEDTEPRGERLAVPPEAHALRVGAKTVAVADCKTDSEGGALAVTAAAERVARTVMVVVTQTEAELERARLPDARALAEPGPSTLAAEGVPTTDGEASLDAEPALGPLRDALALAVPQDALTERDDVTETVLLSVAERQRLGVPLPVRDACASPREGVSVGLALTEAVSPPSPPGLPLGSEEALGVGARGEGEVEGEGSHDAVTKPEALGLPVELLDVEGFNTVPLALNVPSRSVAVKVGIVDGEGLTLELADSEPLPPELLKEARGDFDTEGEKVLSAELEGDAVTEGELEELFVTKFALMLSVGVAVGVFELLAEGVEVLDDEALTVVVTSTELLEIPEGVLLDVMESLGWAELVVVFEAEPEAVGDLEPDVEAVDVAVGVSELVIEPLAEGDTDLPALALSRAERLTEPVLLTTALLVPLSHTSLTSPPMDVAEGFPFVGDSDSRADAVKEGEEETDEVGEAVPLTDAVRRLDAVTEDVPVPLELPVDVPVPPVPDKDTEGDAEGLLDAHFEAPALADTDGETESRPEADEEADTVEVLDSVLEEEAVTDAVGVLEGLVLGVEGTDGVAATDTVDLPFAPPPPGPSSDADAAGEPLALGEGVALRDFTEAVPVEEEEMAELGDAPGVTDAAAEPVLATVRVGSQMVVEGLTNDVRERLGEGDEEADARGEGV